MSRAGPESWTAAEIWERRAALRRTADPDADGAAIAAQIDAQVLQAVRTGCTARSDAMSEPLCSKTDCPITLPHIHRQKRWDVTTDTFWYELRPSEERMLNETRLHERLPLLAFGQDPLPSPETPTPTPPSESADTPQ